MHCPACQADNRDGRRFCGECGASLSATCPDCGFANEPDEKFCGGCGRKIAEVVPEQHPAVGERRPVTVLFADIAGFTKMGSSMDAEEIHRILDRFFEVVDGLVAKFGGAVDKHIGDNVMAVFGAPIAHGDDPVRAIRAAIEIHQAMPRLSLELGTELQVHIGIASGQVVASDTGSSHHKEYTVTGETVNLASRLEGLASAGETLISDAVYRSVKGIVEVVDRGEATVKGLPRPVRIWLVDGMADGAATTGSRLPFVGRRGVLAQFNAILSSCRESNAGQTVLLRGDAGIGKTRLVEEITVEAGRLGFGCHRGLILDFGVGKGKDAIATLARSLLNLPPDPGRETLAGTVEAGFVEAENIMFVYDLLGLPQPEELRAVHDAMDSETRAAGIRKSVCRIIQQASLEKPLLLIVEDIHWAGQSTLEQLAGIAAALKDFPLILILTTRVEGDPIDRDWRNAAGTQLISMDLEPLRPEEAASLAEALFDTSNRFVTTCIERANGNPLFLEQLLRNAEESEDESLPESIQSLVMARLDRLSPEDKRALQAASVLGQRFGLPVLQNLLDSPSYDCGPLLRQALLRPEGADLLFAHALIREGVYASLLSPTRRDLHSRAAAWYVEEDVVLYAEHLDRAGDPSAPGAYLAAARAEASEYRFDRVLELTERGLELAVDRRDRFELTCERGEFLRNLGSAEDSIAAFRDATELAHDDNETSRALIGLAAGMRLTDQYDDALASLDDAQVRATRIADNLTLARIHHLRGNLLFPLGRLEECRQEHEWGLERARHAQSAEYEAAALGGLGDAAYARGRMKTSHDYFARCMEVCRQHGLGRVEVANRTMVGWTLTYLNEYEKALVEGQAASEAAAQLGHPRAEIGGRHCMAFVLIDLGRHDEALRELDKGLALVQRVRAGRFEAQNMCFRAVTLWELGQHKEALALLRDAIALSRQTGVKFIGPHILGSLARRTGDSAERRGALQEAEKILADTAVGHNFYWFYRESMRGALERGEWDEARRFAAALEDYTAAERLPWSDFYIAWSRLLADLGEGRGTERTQSELRRVREIGATAGFHAAVGRIDEALAKQRATG